MEFQIRKAQRKRARLRLGIAAASGAGKTYSSLLIAAGLGERIGVIDTERGSAELYDDLIEGGFDVIQLAPPFEPRRYVQAMHTFEKAGYGTIVIDSLSHAWAGEGGSLDKQGKLADRGTNSFAAWRSITPDHNQLVDAMLQSPAHVIATMRSKTEYVLEADSKGKQVPKKIGMAPVMRDGIEYEFTVMLEIDAHHNATSSKDRTRLFDGRVWAPGKDTGEELIAWLNRAPEPEPEPRLSTEQLEAVLDRIEATDDDELQDRILSKFGVQQLADIPAAAFDVIMRKMPPPANAAMNGAAHTGAPT